MAKKKRRSSKSSNFTTTVAEPTTTDNPVETDPVGDSSGAVGEQFVGQWNRLVSTTNWEKGRIICHWRDALMTSGTAVTEYSDESWAQLVGGVTSQHVGRLRRVYQRFGEAREEYDGLFWSHFQAALDWDDAEMWLEGAIHNEWSISQMRGKRWEALGTPQDEQQADLKAAAVDETNEAEQEATAEEDPSLPSSESLQHGPQPQPTRIVTPEGEEAPVENEPNQEAEESLPQAPAKRVRLNVEVDQLPDDLAEAFESFKLAIIAHRREGWQETTPEMVTSCLDALRELAFAEA